MTHVTGAYETRSDGHLATDPDQRVIGKPRPKTILRSLGHGEWPAPPGVKPSQRAGRGRGRHWRGISRDGTPQGGERLAAARRQLQRRRVDPKAAPRHTPGPTSPETTEPLDPPTPDLYPGRRLTHSLPPHPPASPRVDPTVPIPSSRTSRMTHRTALPAPVAAAPPSATQASRLGWPVQVYLAGRGRGVRRWMIWLAFVAEVVIMLRVVPDRGCWLRDHPQSESCSTRAAGLVKAGCSRDVSSPPKAYATPQCSR
jgi:hypothetical protein